MIENEALSKMQQVRNGQKNMRTAERRELKMRMHHEEITQVHMHAASCESVRCLLDAPGAGDAAHLRDRRLLLSCFMARRYNQVESPRLKEERGCSSGYRHRMKTK